jgi:glycosyltransferase involved in cell wall biosynthesis
VPNIIDLNSFTARALKPHPPCDSAHVVVTRKLEAIYDIPTVLYAFAIIRKKRPAATLTIAGDGPERGKLVALAQDLNVVPYVKFVGNLTNDRIADLLTQADVLVNASLHDNLPISILEALATGVPVVSTNVCGIPFLVKDHTTAILVPPSDPVAIAQGLLELLDNPELKDQLVRNGLELVQQYTWSSVRPRLMDVYSRLINDISE